MVALTLLTLFLIPPFLGNVYAASCPPGNCQVTVNSNVPSADGTIYIQIDNGTGTYCSSNSCTVALPQASPATFSFSYNTTHTLTVLNNTFTGASTSGHYAWKEWATFYGTSSPGTIVWTTNPTVRICPGNSCIPNGVIFNYTGVAGLTAVFDKQYRVTLSFTDANGSPLRPPPTSLSIQTQGSGSLTTLTNYAGQYLSADQYKVVSAGWEGTTLTTTDPQTFDLTSGPATFTISLQAYSATIAIVDKINYPIQGANVTITYVNATVRSYLSNSNGSVDLGDVPIGTVGVSVHYQSQSFGPYSPNFVGNPTYIIQMNVTQSTPSPPPSWPSGSAIIVSSLTTSSLVLSWTPATSSVGIASYRVLENGTLIATVSGNVTSMLVNGLRPGGSYVFEVQAVDRNNNVSNANLSQTQTIPMPQQSMTSLWILVAIGIVATLGLVTTFILVRRRG